MKTVSVDDLLALNEEIRALVRAGVPLENGLAAVGSDLPGRLGALATLLSERLKAGASLSETVRDQQLGLPPLYCAVVAAGVRSGRLAAALEGLSHTARRSEEMRRNLLVSIIYPVFLLNVAVGLLSFMAAKTAPVMEKTYQSLGFARPWWYELIHQWMRVGPWGVAIFGSAVAIAVWLFLNALRRSSVLHGHTSWSLPTLQRIRHAGRMASFADNLALLIDHQVPLDEALKLSADASGDKRLKRASVELAEQVRRGASITVMPRELPPLLAWLVNSHASRDDLVRSLRCRAESYRRRALGMSRWLTTYLPIFMAAGIGGSMTLAFALAVIAPFYHLLNLLTQP